MKTVKAKKPAAKNENVDPNVDPNVEEMDVVEDAVEDTVEETVASGSENKKPKKRAQPAGGVQKAKKKSKYFFMVM